MRTLHRLITASIFIVCGFTLSLAQESEFELTSGRVGEVYQQSIDKILAQKYRLRLDTGVQGAAFEWAAVESLPAGLRLNSDGTITGVPQSHQAQPYRFRVKITDRSIRDAEALELAFSIQMLPPRIKLVSSNAPRLVPTYSAPEQSSLPAGSTSVALADGNGNGNGNGNVGATSESVAAQPIRQSRLAPPSEVQPQDAGNLFTPAPTPQEADAAQAFQALNIEKYISIVEETSGGNKFTLTLPGKVVDDLARLAGSQIENKEFLKSLSEAEREKLLKPLENINSNINFRLRSDRESTLVIQGVQPQSTSCPVTTGQSKLSGLKYIVSAELIQEKGSTPLPLIGSPLDVSQNAGLIAPGSLQVQLSKDAPLATLNLKQADAEANDEVRLIIEAICNSTDSANAKVLGRRSYDIELTNFGWESGVSPSVFLINRQSVRRIDEQPNPTTTTPGALTNPINPVNYSPFTGASYIFSYKGEQRNKGKRTSRILSFLQPGFGVNATFMDFNDQTIDFQNFNAADFKDKIFDKDSDVQVGLGAVATFFGNKIQITYGGNLAVDRKRAYFGFGLDFLKLFGLFQ
jgi:hypothetical protein